MELQTKLLSVFANVCVFVDEMKQLAVDFGSILHKAGLPPVMLKHGDSMIGVTSSFERHYVKAENSDLNLRTHMFGGQAVTLVMESLQRYYHFVEQAALKMQAVEEKEQVMKMIPLYTL